VATQNPGTFLMTLQLCGRLCPGNAAALTAVNARALRRRILVARTPTVLLWSGHTGPERVSYFAGASLLWMHS